MAKNKDKNTESKNEKQVATTASVLEALKANASSKGGRRLKDRKYTVVLSPVGIEDVRLAPQAIVLLGLILEDNTPEMHESDLSRVIEAGRDQIKSKQEPWKVFQYYRKQLETAGFLVLVV